MPVPTQDHCFNDNETVITDSLLTSAKKADDSIAVTTSETEWRLPLKDKTETQPSHSDVRPELA